MGLRKFDHIAAKSLDEAVALVGSYRKRAAVIAGGTDLLGILKDAVHPVYPQVLIDLKAIEGLDFIREDDERHDDRSPYSPLRDRAERDDPGQVSLARRCRACGRFAAIDGTWVPSAATSARSRAAGIIAIRTMPSTACARAARNAMP